MTVPLPLEAYDPARHDANRRAQRARRNAERPPAGTLATEPSPWTNEPRLHVRSLLRDLHDGYRDYASRRCNVCSRVMLNHRVTIERSTEHGTCHYSGVARCGLVWECPDCGAAIKAERAKDLTKVFKWHRDRFGDEGVSMLTLTVAHSFGDDVRQLVKGVADAWRAFCQGGEWQEWRRRVGFVGSARALEVTFGPNGAHPHLHIALLTRADLTTTRAFLAWAYRRWAQAVRRKLGDDFVPSAEHGATVTRLGSDGAYLTKLGLEVSAPNTKRAKGENRTPLDLLAAFVIDGDYDGLKLYRKYVRALKGRRQLTYSVGLLEAAGVRDRSDEECADAGEETERVAVLTGDEFKALRMAGATSTVLELAERHGAPAVYWFVAILVQGDESCEERHRKAESLRQRALNFEWEKR